MTNLKEIALYMKNEGIEILMLEVVTEGLKQRLVLKSVKREVE